MSERPPGIPEAIPPRPRESAVVIVARKAAGEWELLMGLRSRRSGFFPGNWAFPGGRLDPEDLPGRPGAHARCGARELLEETGVRIAPEKLVSIGFKTTPPFHPLRYRTEFFVVEAPARLGVPDVIPSPDETEELRFVSAREALDAWERGTMFFPPPLPPLLRVFAREARARFDQLPHLLEVVNAYEERVPRIEFVPWVWMYPVASPTLPPATHTNAWIAGGRRVVLVDPGTTERWDLEQLALVVERRCRMGAVLDSILLTHHHRDHVAGAPELADRFGVPVRAHAATAEALAARGLPVDVRPDLEDGARLDLEGLSITVHHAPGHTAGHVVLEVPERRVALVGDLLSGFSTIVIAPGEGDMGAYMDSLRRIARLDVDLLFPAHGPPLVPAALAAALAHREEREARVLAAVGDVPLAIGEIAARAYADTPDAPSALAAVQARAHLDHLESIGAVVRREGEPETWVALAPPCAQAGPED